MKSPLSFPVAAALLLSAPAFAASFTTSVTQGVGANWNAAIWTPEGGGTAVPPSAGNTYTVLSNGTAVRIGTAAPQNARIRNPTSAGLQTFPGDLLTITTNAEFRFKTGTGLGPINFPGVGDAPGLVMDGGIWNIADAFVPTVTGRVHIATAMLYDAVNDHGGGLDATRGVNLNAVLSGSGTFIAFNAHTNTPIRIANDNNTFNGKWLITGGRLLGQGRNSLGTNDITIDPQATLGLSEELEGALKRGPAVLDLAYDLNSAGTLTLINGGMMILRQNCAFTAVNIEGTLLSPGTHSYAELASTYPATFLPGGSGAITVQPYGALPLLIIQQPLSQSRYAGGTITLKVTASSATPVSYQWQKKSGDTFVNVTDGAGISGATTASLAIADFNAAKAGEYRAVVSNGGAAVNSASALLTAVQPAGGAYETAVLAAKPWAYYELNDSGDPASGTAVAFDYVGGFNGTYGTSMQNGHPSYNIAGPLPSGNFPGFPANNKAAMGFNIANALNFDAFNSRIDTPAWNLNTNTVTMTAWIFPVGQPAARSGIIFTRGGNTIAGIYFSGTANPSGNFSIGYNWNDEGPTFNWNSGLEVTADQWNFVALTVTPTNATLYVVSPGTYKSAVNTHAHVVEPFNGPGMIGNDTFNAEGLRAFYGRIDEVAIFNRSLPASEILSLYGAAAGVAQFPPTISTQPVAQSEAYVGQTLTLRVIADGSPAPTFKWRFRQAGGTFVDLVDGANISGSTTSTLAISNLAQANAGEYVVVITNPISSVTSDPAVVSVLPTGPAEAITTSAFLAIGQDWNSPDVWSDGLTAAVSAVAKPGSTYEVLPGARLRSPDGALDSTFPGDTLIISGDGVFANNPGAGSPIGELRFKQGGPVGRVYIKKLVMNGGQLDPTNPNVLILDGQVDIRANTPIYNDTTGDRGLQLNSRLTGDGTIEYHAYNLPALNPNFIYNLNITGTSNTFSGKWNIVLGVLLGTGSGSLGTNDITIAEQGALELLYNLNSPKATLTLNGKFYLHQNVTFKNVIINGTALAPGTYTYAQLAAAHPQNFPASWTTQSGSTVNAASGSIIVLGESSNLVLQHERVGGNLRLSWQTGQLQESTTLAPNSWTTLNVASPQTITPSGPAKFYRLIVQ